MSPEIAALLKQARKALVNPVDGDGLRTHANCDTVAAIDRALAEAQQKGAA